MQCVNVNVLIVCAFEGIPFHKQHMNVGLCHEHGHGLPAQIYEQRTLHNLDNCKVVGLHETLTGNKKVS